MTRRHKLSRGIELADKKRPLTEKELADFKINTTYRASDVGSPVRYFCDTIDTLFSDVENAVYMKKMVPSMRCIYCSKPLYEWNSLTDSPYLETARGSKTRKTDNGTAWDHIEPVRRFGIRTLGNFILVHSECNTLKNGYAPLDFWRSLPERGLSPLHETEEEFLAFLEEFSAPYRENFPELYAMTKDYVDFDQEQASKNLIYMLSMRDGNGNLSIQIDRASNGVRWLSVGPNADIWEKMKDILSEGGTKKSYGKTRQVMEIANREFPGVKIEDMETSQLASLFSMVINKNMVSHSTYEQARRTLRVMGEVIGFPAFEARLNKMGSWNQFLATLEEQGKDVSHLKPYQPPKTKSRASNREVSVRKSSYMKHRKAISNG